jgi:hypothetical protein
MVNLEISQLIEPVPFGEAAKGALVVAKNNDIR